MNENIKGKTFENLAEARKLIAASMHVYSACADAKGFLQLKEWEPLTSFGLLGVYNQNTSNANEVLEFLHRRSLTQENPEVWFSKTIDIIITAGIALVVGCTKDGIQLTDAQAIVSKLLSLIGIKMVKAMTLDKATESTKAPKAMTAIHYRDEREPTLQEVHKLIGGMIAITTMSDGRQMIVNEDGQSLKLPANQEASRIAGQIILGDVMILSALALMK